MEDTIHEALKSGNSIAQPKRQDVPVAEKLDQSREFSIGGHLFQWLSEFREEAARREYVTGPRGRKYLTGLRSSSIDKRKKAAGASVRWLIGWEADHDRSMSRK